MTEPRLLDILDMWAKWMHSYGLKLGYPSKSLVMMTGGGEYGQGHEIMCDEMDETICFAIDAAIDSLMKAEIAAINARYLHSIKPAMYEFHLRNAMNELIILCNKKNII